MYFQPLVRANISICGTSDINCVKWVDKEILLKKNSEFTCKHCLPGCFSLNYKTSFSMSKIFGGIEFLQRKKLNPKNVAILHVYYSRTTFRAQKKEELVGVAEFLANLGGLLGLFLGFSGISVIEIFYFISIRPYCQYLRISNQWRELTSKLIRKIHKLRYRHQSSIMIKTVQPNLSFDYTDYPHLED